MWYLPVKCILYNVHYCHEWLTWLRVAKLYSLEESQHGGKGIIRKQKGFLSAWVWSGCDVYVLLLSFLIWVLNGYSGSETLYARAFVDCRHNSPRLHTYIQLVVMQSQWWTWTSQAPGSEAETHLFNFQKCRATLTPHCSLSISLHLTMRYRGTWTLSLALKF